MEDKVDEEERTMRADKPQPPMGTKIKQGNQAPEPTTLEKWKVEKERLILG